MEGHAFPPDDWLLVIAKADLGSGSLSDSSSVVGLVPSECILRTTSTSTRDLRTALDHRGVRGSRRSS